ncbi:MAG: hypothetical protein EKK62_07635 [Acidimicrobiia bacterium]|nr:MAG: hypothetical protein EKK62_07635 [Acidimicrobiia bacterium]
METMTFVAPGETTDEYGNVVADWGNATEVDVPGCRFAPKLGDEIGTEGTAVRTAGVVYAPGTATVAADCRIVIRGALYEVVGDPALWANGYSRTGWEIAVARVVGADTEVGS